MSCNNFNTRNSGCGCNNMNSCNCNNCSGTMGANYYPTQLGINNCTGSPFPPIGSVCNTCPPGTRPCPCHYFHHMPPFCNGGGQGINNNPGSYAFFNTSGTTLTTGSVIPYRYVIGSGELGRGTTGGTVNLGCGTYSVEYSLSAAADSQGAIITVTPEYLGALHPEYARSFTTSAAGQTFDIASSFVVNIPTDTTLSLVVTITEPDATTTTTLTGVNASMLLRRVSCYGA